MFIDSSCQILSHTHCQAVPTSNADIFTATATLTCTSVSPYHYIFIRHSHLGLTCVSKKNHKTILVLKGYMQYICMFCNILNTYLRMLVFLYIYQHLLEKKYCIVLVHIVVGWVDNVLSLNSETYSLLGRIRLGLRQSQSRIASFQRNYSRFCSSLTKKNQFNKYINVVKRLMNFI